MVKELANTKRRYMMKRSELNTTGDFYNLTPDSWGEQYIMIDEDMAVEGIKISFGDESMSLLGESLEKVEIFHDKNEEQFYAVMSGINDGLFMECSNPSESDDGFAELGSYKWDTFDDE